MMGVLAPGSAQARSSAHPQFIGAKLWKEGGGQRWKKGWKWGRNFPESIMVGRKFSATERCFDIILVTVHEKLKVFE
jgi:hypothetical protein